MSKRIIAVFSALLLAFLGIVIRLGYVGGDSGRFFAAAQRQSGLTVTVASQRGTIYDRYRRPLVNQKTEYRVCVSPYATELSSLMSALPTDQRQAVMTRLKEGKPAVQTVSGLLPTAQGVLQFLTKSRYGDLVLAPHLIGYLDGDGLHGVTGIEAAFDDRLTAATGQLEVTYAVDGTGSPLKGVEPTVRDTLDNSRAGVVLTLDTAIQRAVESILDKELPKGAALVMEPKTGRILAMASRPDYQPSTVAQVLHTPEAPLINRALSNYNCGSVFKIVSVAAALEKGVSPDTAYTCTGSYTIGDTVFHCHNKLGHGTVTMKEAFAESCNCYFIQLIQEVGAVPLRRMAESLGFDQAVSLAGRVKTARASLPSVTQLINPAALANLSFGQGELLASPVHIAQMMTAVLGDGAMKKATVLQGFCEADGGYQEEALAPAQTAFSAQTAARLREFLAYAVEKGSGQKAKPTNTTAAGKTGTAETGWTQNGEEIVQSWFAGYYPAENPRYIVVVLAEDKNNTGVMAAPVFRKLCDGLDVLS